MTINTREELTNALREAAEIEHALLVQYIFTALTLKKSTAEGLSGEQARMVREWEEIILGVAREEMGHLAIVFNLLAAIGEPPTLTRLPMPRKSDYYPFAFDLLPFGDEALHRFLTFELPRDHPPPRPPGANLGGFMIAAHVGPDPLSYRLVGELYAQIAKGFEAIPEAELFIGPKEAQADNDWSVELDVRMATTRAQALSAIQNIIEDGEGAPNKAENSHFRRFERIRQDYFDAGRFDAARAVMKNPATRLLPGVTGDPNVITNPKTLELAKLFNVAYGFMLLTLQYYFTSAPTDDDARGRREELRRCSQRLMSIAIRPIAEELTRAPFADNIKPERAGPTFEITSSVTTSPYATVKWTLVLERFADFIAACDEVKGDFPRIGTIGETLRIMRDDLSEAAG